MGNFARASRSTTGFAAESQRRLLYLGKFVVEEITTTIRTIPVEVRLGSREGMPTPCVANLDNIRTAARQWFESRAGTLAPSRHREVKRALGYALGWDELIDLGAGPSG